MSEKMGNATNILLALVMFFGIMTINEQLLVNRLVLPLFSAEYIKEHFWIRNYIHHLGQMILSLAVIVFILKGSIRDHGLNAAKWSLSRKYILWFAVVYGGLTVINFLPNFLGGEPAPLGFSPSSFNLLGWISFQALMSGTSEEIFFRGLLQTFLGRAWKGSVRIIRVNVPTAGIISALIFTFAHTDISFAPFSVSYDVFQLALAFILGLFYAIAYDRTKSLIAPIVTHNFANFIMYPVSYLTIILFS